MKKWWGWLTRSATRAKGAEEGGGSGHEARLLSPTRPCRHLSATDDQGADVWDGERMEGKDKGDIEGSSGPEGQTRERQMRRVWEQEEGAKMGQAEE